jgi:hypothetical protein
MYNRSNIVGGVGQRNPTSVRGEPIFKEYELIGQTKDLKKADSTWTAS